MDLDEVTIGQGGCMTRLLAIVVLIVFAFVLFRYRTNEKVQKATIIILIGAFLIYTASIMVAELIR
jgi:uncharacterized membrane protein SirB2